MLNRADAARAADAVRIRVVIYDPTDRLTHPYGHSAHISSRYKLIMQALAADEFRLMAVRDAKSRKEFVILADARGVENKKPWALSLPPMPGGRGGLPIPLVGTLIFCGGDAGTGRLEDYPLSFAEHKAMLKADAVRIRKTGGQEKK